MSQVLLDFKAKLNMPLFLIFDQDQYQDEQSLGIVFFFFLKIVRLPVAYFMRMSAIQLDGLELFLKYRKRE